MTASSPKKKKATLHEDVRALKVAHILEAASALLVERGFVGTTMDAMAERLAMSKPFIYQFFENKHAVLVALYDRELRDSLSVLSDPLANEGTSQQRLVHFVAVATRKNIVNRELSSALALEEKHLPKEKMAEIRALEVQFHRRLTSIIKDGIGEGAFHANDPQLASRAVMGMTQWVKRWYRPSKELSADEIANEFCELALRMVGFRSQ